MMDTQTNLVRIDEQWLDSGYVLKIELMRLVDELNWGI